MATQQDCRPNRPGIDAIGPARTLTAFGQPQAMDLENRRERV